MEYITDDASINLARSLQCANRALNRALTDALSRHQLLPTEFEVLRMLAAGPHGTLRVGELVSPSTTQFSGMSRLIDRLILQRLVTRENNPDDRRVQKVTITAAGRDRLRRAQETHRAAVARILGETGLTLEKSAILARLLEQLSQSAHAA